VQARKAPACYRKESVGFHRLALFLAAIPLIFGALAVAWVTLQATGRSISTASWRAFMSTFCKRVHFGQMTTQIPSTISYRLRQRATDRLEGRLPHKPKAGGMLR